MLWTHQSHFKQAAVTCFISHLKVVHFKQTSVIGFHSHLLIGIDANFCLPFSRRSDPFLISPLCIKFLLPINKQLSIASFLDWESQYWVFAQLNQITATHSLKYRTQRSHLFNFEDF